MQKVLVFTLLLLLQFTTFAQDLGHKVEELTQKRQYAQAWEILEKHANDSSAANVMERTAFALRYFAHTLFHQKFYFVDLSDTSILLDYRQKAPSTDLVFANFNPELLLNTLLAKEPENARLHLALGDYYYDVYITYHDQWKKSGKELMALFYYHYLEAQKKKVETPQSCYAISLFYQSRKTFGKAKDYLLQTLSLDTTYAPAHYNLAYSYTLEDSNYLAISHAQAAYRHYDQSDLKADAASMAGILLGDLNKPEDAINWLLISDTHAPGNYFVYQSLLEQYMKLGKAAEADLITKNLYSFDWKTGKVFNGILEIYLKRYKADELEDYLIELLKEEPHDEEFRGFAYLHLAQLYFLTDRYEATNSALDNAKNSFNTAYDPNHSIYRVLEKFEYTLKQSEINQNGAK